MGRLAVNDPLDFTGDAVYDFLAAGDTTKATMHNRVSALRYSPTPRHDGRGSRQAEL